MKEFKELTYNDLPDEVDIVGISFRTAGKIYYFAAGGVICKEGQHAIVETARGAEYGIVTLENHFVPKKDLVLPLRSVIRVATPEDDERFVQNARKEEEAYGIALKKIAEHKLDMKLVDVEYTFDNSKLLFYFTAEDRVDFRELVKDLASVFRTRIELRQIGIRDEAKMMGGLGICGREFCCHSFLGDFAQVTIKMAKEQNLSLNAAKISGACGKLMCCLRYEHESYQQEIALTPKVDSRVMTPDGAGTVLSNEPLKGLCTVRLDKAQDGEPVRYHRDQLIKPGEGDKLPPAPAPVPRTEQGKKSAEPKERPAREATLRTEAAERREKPIPAPTPVVPAAEATEEQSTTEDTPRTHSGDRRNSRGSRDRRRRGDHRDKSENTKEGKEGKDNREKDSKESTSVPADKQEKAAPAPGRPKGDRRHSAPRHNRPAPAAPTEKKSDSKFDVHFAGGNLPAEPRSGEQAGEGRNSAPRSGEGRPHHRRGGRGHGKNSEKKPQKTENNN